MHLQNYGFDLLAGYLDWRDLAEKNENAKMVGVDGAIV